MKIKAEKIIIWGVVGLIIAGTVGFVVYQNTRPGKLDDFAKCLDDKGAKFFGAFWCPHCQAQKALFGSSAQYLPYIECSTADGKGMTQICQDNKIEGFPTWEFADKSRLSGEVSLAKLSEKTSCELPK